MAGNNIQRAAYLFLKFKITEMKNRFSKNAMIDRLVKEIELLEVRHKFKSYYGWDQVNGKGEEINRAYGRYTALLELCNEVQDNNLYQFN